MGGRRRCGMESRRLLLLLVCALLATASVSHDPEDDKDDIVSAESSGPAVQLRGGGVEAGHEECDLLSGTSCPDATDEFLEEIYTKRPAVVASLLRNLNETALVASLRNESDECDEYGGRARAMCSLGNICAADGHLEDAVACFKASAELLDVGGMFNYAQALLRGKGCGKDESGATRWFREAASLICDTKRFLARHLPARVRVSEPGHDGEDVLSLTYDDDHAVTRVADSASGRVWWDAANYPARAEAEEALQQLLEGLEITRGDEAGEELAQERAAPRPLEIGFKMAAIDMAAFLHESQGGLSAAIDLDDSSIGIRKGDGRAAQLSTKEALAALLLQVSVNREAPLQDQAGTAALAEAEAWQTALALLNKGAADGDGHMHAILGALYAHGLGVTTPTQAGAEARLRALAENHAEPEDVAAEIEKMEDEVWAERRALAKQHFQQAAAKGVAEAMNNLAVLVIQEEEAAAAPTPTTPVAPVGLGRVWPVLPAVVKRVVSGLLRTGDMTPGGQWLLRAARAGCPTAKFNLARALQEGGAPAREVAAMYEEAARAGCGAAMNNLALLYLSGRHPAGRKPEQARKWLRKAAEEPSGVALASDATAKDLFDGADFDESEPDRELAQVPGKNPEVEALYNLGLVHELGIGAKAHMLAAARWYALALEKGLRERGGAEGVIV